MTPKCNCNSLAGNYYHTLVYFNSYKPKTEPSFSITGRNTAIGICRDMMKRKHEARLISEVTGQNITTAVQD